MTQLTTANTKLITMPIFGLKKTEEGKLKVGHTCVINYGEVIGDDIKHVTKDGELIKNKYNFPTPIQLVSFDEICPDYFFSKWSLLNNSDLPIVLDESIETNEIYENQYSPLKVMVERRKDVVAIKPIFDLS